MTERPLELLHAIAGPDADFRPGQREAIDAVVTERSRVLGDGKIVAVGTAGGARGRFGVPVTFLNTPS